MNDTMLQLRFKCPECEASGLTPEMSHDRAIAVIRKELSLSCPRCSAVIDVHEPLLPTLLSTRFKELEEVDKTFREAIQAEVERRSQDRHDRDS